MTPELNWPQRWAEISPHAVALIDGETRASLTYKELFEHSENLASFLADHWALARGERIACMAQNELEYIVLLFAAARLGAILVPINTRFTTSEVTHIVKDCRPRLLVVDAASEPVVAPLDVPRLSFADLQGACRRPRSQNIPVRARDFEDTLLILYTSGTTGFPKGAMISHRMIFWNSVSTGLRLNLTQKDVVVTFLPLFHTGGWNVLTTPCLHRGAQVVLLKKFDAARVLSVCEQDRVTVLFGVPTTMDFLRRHETFARTDLSSIRYAIVGGEPMPVELIRVWEDRGIPIRQGFGLTEFGPNVFSLNEEDSRSKIGSIGFPNFYVTVRVVHETGLDAGAGEVGELLLQGPMMMSGYWNNPEATAQTIRDGWLATGDLVRRDDEGYFYVVGRKKEMFISGGENVYPAEVEKVLRGLPGVREVAVIGASHPRWGECGKAFLALENGAEVATEVMREHCLKHLAKFKVPLEYIVLPELPKTQSGKVAKNELR